MQVKIDRVPQCHYIPSAGTMMEMVYRSPPRLTCNSNKILVNAIFDEDNNRDESLEYICKDHIL